MQRKPATTGFWRGRLPHWEVEDGRYFVTIHLAGAIPQQGIDRIRRLSERLDDRVHRKGHEEQLRVSRLVFREMECWLDRSQDNRWLEVPPVAAVIMEAIQFRVNSGQWEVLQFVLMPNHIHLFLSISDMTTLKESIEDFKRWTGHQAAKLIDLPHGRFWQDEWFDHWSRSDEQDERIVKYIQNNPVAAGLVEDFCEWSYGSWSR